MCGLEGSSCCFVPMPQTLRLWPMTGTSTVRFSLTTFVSSRTTSLNRAFPGNQFFLAQLDPARPIRGWQVVSVGLNLTCLGELYVIFFGGPGLSSHDLRIHLRQPRRRVTQRFRVGPHLPL